MNTAEFIKQVSADPAACEKMAACTSPEEAYKLACESGLTDTLEAFTGTMQAARAQMSELSEDDLEGLNAAGSTTNIATLTVATGVGTAGIAIASAGV